MLDRLFAPTSVAVVGASGREGNPFARPLQYLVEMGYGGQILPVNPGYEELRGLRCYPSLAATGVSPDLVLVLVPAKDAVQAVQEAADLGAGAVILFTSGFAETGDVGRKAQQQLAEIARSSGMRIVGPNCQGVYFQPSNLVATFTGAVIMGLPEPTGVAYVGQSGAVGGSILDLARERGVGMTAWVSVGNQSDLSVSEVALDLVRRDEIEVLSLYLESLDDGAAFTELATVAAELDKRVVVLRSGRTEVGKRAAASHTGALLPPGAEFNAMAERSGVLLVDDVDELLDASYVMSRLGRGHGKRVAIVTSSGGAGAIAADHIADAGLEVPQLPQELRAQLSEVIPDFGSVDNPVDVTAQLFSHGVHKFGEVCAQIAANPEIDQLAVVLTMVTGESANAVAADIAEIVDTTGTPVHLCWLAGHEQTAEARSLLRRLRVPVHDSVRRLASAIRWASTPTYVHVDAGPTESIDLPQNARVLTEWQLRPLLEQFGVAVPRSILVGQASEAEAAVAELGGRVVCKGQGADVLHKSELGLVQLGVTTNEATTVVGGFLDILGERGDGVLIQEQLAPGLELLIGVTSAVPGLPPLLTIGMGGIQTELVGDVVSECLPVDRDRIRRMLERLKTYPLLVGYRGGPNYDVDAAVDSIFGVARLATAFGDRLDELEVNPIIVQQGKGGAHAADAFARLREPSTETRSN